MKPFAALGAIVGFCFTMLGFYLELWVYFFCTDVDLAKLMIAGKFLNPKNHANAIMVAVSGVIILVIGLFFLSRSSSIWKTRESPAFQRDIEQAEP